MADPHKGIDFEALGKKDQVSKGEIHLLAIAIDTYEHCPKLNNCVRDARDFVALMQERYQVSSDHTYTLYNEESTRANVLKELKQLRGKIGKEDNLILYFSGHGEVEDEEAYWVPVEGKPQEDWDWIPADRIKRLLNAIDSFHTLVIVDACFSGSFFLTYKSGTRKLLQNRRSRLGMSASHSRERALDGKAGENSPFAKELLAALRQNGEPLPVDALFTQVRDAVQQATKGKQTPIFKNIDVKGDEQGQFVFEPAGGEERDWRIASEENNIPAYFHYIQQHPQGKYKAEASRQIKKLEEEQYWQRCQQSDTLSAYLNFLERFPNGVFASEAKSRQEELIKSYKAPSPKIKRPKIILPEKKQLIDDGLIFIPGGSFEMGSNDFKSEQPIHTVTVPDFYMAKYPVTYEEYDRFCEETGASKPSDQGWGRGQRPVIDVSWEDAVAYCKWLSKKTGYEYRLPSEAEWEYAARGGKKGLNDYYKYSGSNTLDEVGWYVANSEKKTQPVGQKKPNQLGLYDMSGNVWEWCVDHWHKNYNTAPSNGSPWLKGGNEVVRVVRGGSWLDYDFICRVSNRGRSNHSNRGNDVGFRIARY